MVSQQVQASVVEELGNRGILPNEYVSSVIENKSDLGKHVADVVAAGDQPLTNSPTTVTSDINYWRSKFRNKMPVSESAVASAIEGGIDRVISEKAPSEPGHKNLADLLKKLGIRQIELADDICMAMF
ncbi:MAG: hypothetical protein AABY33_09655 [Pseudomonadota bacterium]